MAKKQKYYVVWQGAKPGIYTSWETCQGQINGFPGARYKSFETKSEAEQAYLKPPAAFNRTGAAPGKTNASTIAGGRRKPYPSLQNSICVDAACSGNPGDLEYRGVDPAAKTQLFHVGPLAEGTNNIGEFLAIVHALALLQRDGRNDTVIFSDSRTGMAWVKNKKIKTTLQQSPRNEKLFDLVERALTWLNVHTWKNPIVKWETEDWGEIPADFGRK